MGRRKARRDIKEGIGSTVMEVGKKEVKQGADSSQTPLPSPASSRPSSITPAIHGAKTGIGRQ